MSSLSPSPSPRAIRTLSQGMINKIAAGEVIERPASVVKELVENALDAGATRIDIAVEEGGASLLRIVDNGCGIASDELVLALSPHSTSKLTDADELFRIETFGFRGEALASIAEISQLTLRSCAVNAREGASITSHGGTISQGQPCGHPQGTTIEVRNLFFNTPVRRKYLRATATEFGHLAETFIRLALPNLHCHFTLQHNGRSVHDLAAGTSLEQRMTTLLGRELAGNLVAIENMRGATTVSGLAGRPSVGRSSNRWQYFFLNRRFIRDRSLQHALGEAYRGLLGVGRFPVACLHLTLPSDQFDVNVHPAKLEVRFLDGQRLYAHILAAIRDQFLTTNLTVDRTPAPIDAPRLDSRHEMRDETRDETGCDAKLRPARIAAFDVVRETSLPVTEPNDPRTALALSSADTRRRVDEWTASPNAAPTSTSPTSSSSSTITSTTATLSTASASVSSPSFLASSVVRKTVAMQYHHRYLIVETDDGIDIIDQHALHERILFERLKAEFDLGRLESQRLLTPLPVDLSPVEAVCVREQPEFLASLGLAVEPFGGDTVLISAYPTLMAKVAPQEILLALLGPLLQRGHRAAPSELLDEVLHSMACRAAVKAGDSMNASAIECLISLASAHPHTSHCPHGRPTTRHFTCAELDKMFHR